MPKAELAHEAERRMSTEREKRLSQGVKSGIEAYWSQY